MRWDTTARTCLALSFLPHGETPDPLVKRARHGRRRRLAYGGIATGARQPCATSLCEPAPTVIRPQDTHTVLSTHSLEDNHASPTTALPARQIQ
jgi:hypothetical protein